MAESGELVEYTTIESYSQKSYKVNFQGTILFVPKSNVINKNSTTKKLQVKTWYFKEVLSKLLKI